MAIQKGNYAMVGLKGNIGGLLVYKRVRGKLVVAKMPEFTKPASDKQKAHRNRFKEAGVYAKTLKEGNSELYEKYEQIAKSRNLTTRNLILQDFLTAPRIEHINTSHYDGTVGSTISIEATDTVEVKSVTVKILKANDTLVEEGKAVKLEGRWTYTVSTANTPVANSKVVVTAEDLPGNITEREAIV